MNLLAVLVMTPYYLSLKGNQAVLVSVQVFKRIDKMFSSNASHFARWWFWLISVEHTWWKHTKLHSGLVDFDYFWPRKPWVVVTMCRQWSYSTVDQLNLQTTCRNGPSLTHCVSDHLEHNAVLTVEHTHTHRFGYYLKIEMLLARLT